MKITYTAPNRSHHYPYVSALDRSGNLYKFISGFSRFSPRCPLPEIGDKLIREDFYQNLYLAGNKFNFPSEITTFFNQLSHQNLDRTSYKWAKESDAFIFYRTEGYETTKKLKLQSNKCICILEEVNSHVDVCTELMKSELQMLDSKVKFEPFSDHKLRLETYEIADYILCPSEFVVNSFLSKGFSKDKLIKVNFGVNIFLQNATLNKSIDSKFRVLFVGQLNYRKGLRNAIEAFEKLKYPNKEFVIVGPKTSITGLENLKIPKEVVFTGELKGESLANVYQKATLFILPSIEEGLALVQCEALSYGLPLLITTNTGGGDIITDGVEGFIVPAFDSVSLSEKLQQLADNPLLIEQMSEAAKLKSKTLGGWDKAALELVSKIQLKIEK